MTDLCATAGVRSCDGFSHGPEMSGGIPVSRGTYPVRGRSVPYMVRYVSVSCPECVSCGSGYLQVTSRDLPGKQRESVFGGSIVRRTTVVFADRRVWSV